MAKKKPERLPTAWATNTTLWELGYIKMPRLLVTTKQLKAMAGRGEVMADMGVLKWHRKEGGIWRVAYRWKRVTKLPGLQVAAPSLETPWFRIEEPWAEAGTVLNTRQLKDKADRAVQEWIETLLSRSRERYETRGLVVYRLPPAPSRKFSFLVPNRINEFVPKIVFLELRGSREDRKLVAVRDGTVLGVFEDEDEARRAYPDCVDQQTAIFWGLDRRRSDGRWRPRQWRGYKRP